ncbi:MAG: apolipoprotein N-acyltransferase [Planctomycetaceae bacterium]
MDTPAAAARRDGRALLVRALGGALAMFLVQPPAGLWMLAWVAPVPWLLVVRDGCGAARRPWATLWLGGLVHWLLAVHWLRLPHPATSIGWVALSAYLGLFLPLFVWSARRLVVRHGWPIEAAAALAWAGCEQLRGTILGGFTLGSLGHTQWRWTTLLQSADWGGAPAVGAIVVLAAAALVTASGTVRGAVTQQRAAAGLLAAGLVLGGALGYGRWRIAGAPADPRSLDVLLVQGSIDTELKHDPEAAARVLEEYDGLTRAALGDGPRPDLIVWPETMWRWPVIGIAADCRLPEDVVERVVGPRGTSDGESDASRQARSRAILEQDRLDPLAAHARRYGATWLVGVDRQQVPAAGLEATLHYNTALFLDASGTPIGRYDKMFPVMFGEAVPLADRFPLLQRLTPLPVGLTAGDAPVAVTVAGLRVAPTICYETALPDAIRGVVDVLAAAGARPDVLVNLTNDGWFWGSSELDMHLACGMFRAVEVRTPLAIAANTGFSAAIDGCGRLLERGPRRATGTIRRRLHPDGRVSPWLAVGPVAPATCAGLVGLLVLLAALESRVRAAAASRAATLTAAQTLPSMTGGGDGLQDR